MFIWPKQREPVGATLHLRRKSNSVQTYFTYLWRNNVRWHVSTVTPSHSDCGNLPRFIVLSYFQRHGCTKKTRFHWEMRQCRSPIQTSRIKTREKWGMSAKVSGFYLQTVWSRSVHTRLSYCSPRRRIKVFVLWRESLQTCLWGARLFFFL